ncbi:SPOR domain-containing protein [Paracidovorax anthurii]|uniref:DedD protein n=1 Tax=Paracidovorax anthurii TaxID=78229 RepID=A0A328ZLS3_9BURK|nr:SPOR domain-containing protein [Paracidovorax anthurii]RAR85622.1 DedD protein [Paracidovorax anthurii]
MAFFKFRWPGRKEQPEKPAKRSRSSSGAQAESIEVMRRRARHRLIGAAVLVLVGIVGFPMLFDTQPRPIPVDIPIDIPDRNKVAPLVVPESAPATPSAAASAAPSGSGSPSAGLSDGEEVVPPSRSAAVATPHKPEVHADSRPAAPKVAEPKPAAKPAHESRPEPKPEPKPAPAAESRPQTQPAAPRDDAARARALLEGRDGSAAPAAAAKSEDLRLIVQVGAFADADKAREVRQSLERSGLKTYTQVVDTKDGKRTRVRVGPFSTKAEADKAAARIKGLGLSASVLTL